MSTVLITGVTDGIGLALAKFYRAAGSRVLVVGRRDPDSLPFSLLAGLAYCQVDLARPEAGEIVGHFVRRQDTAGVDILVHNAGVGWYGPVAQQSSDSINELLAVNLHAPIALTHTLLPYLRDRRGLIVFVSSVHVVLPTPNFAVYTATKAALDGFARSLRIEQAGQVDMITLWVGPTRTTMHAKSGVPAGRLRTERFPTPEETAERMAAAIARRRSTPIGAGNRLLHWFGAHLETWVDGAMAATARRGTG